MRLGIIGAGRISEFHAKAIAAIEGTSLVTMTSRLISPGGTDVPPIAIWMRSCSTPVWKWLRFVHRVVRTWNP